MKTADHRPHAGGPVAALVPRLYRAFELLLDAHNYARELDRSLWDFAVEIRALQAAGLSSSDFRWLICKGYVGHARETTPAEGDRRSFQRMGELMLSKRTCFVLSDAGVSFARCLGPGLVNTPEPAAGDARPGSNGAPDPASIERMRGLALAPLAPPPAPAGPSEASRLVPQWDRDRQELRLGGVLVKQFKVPAPNQEVVLAAFHEEGWPVRIDDPLPGHPDQDPKRRLHETITSLNRKQRHRLIHFMGDGSGQGVLWEAGGRFDSANGSA
jgi:hypothetical protein